MQPTQPPRRPVSRAKLGAIIGILAVILIVVVALFVIPFSHGFSGIVSTSYCSGCGPSYYVGSGSQTFPTGSAVTLSWQCTSTCVVSFSVFSLSAPLSGDVCDQTSIGGSCSFTASAGTYTIFVEDTEESQGVLIVSYSGSYTAPVL
jgi:hypothetical protein